MTRVHVIDSSAIVDASRYWYGPETHPHFWPYLMDACGRGEVIIPYEVLDELRATNRDDEIGLWLQKHRKLLGTQSGPNVQRIVGRLVQAYPGIGGTGVGDKNYADPFVIAHAIAATKDGIEGFVITHEEMAKKDRRPKIPNVCQAEGLRAQKIHEVVKRHNLPFSLDGH